MNIRHRKIAIGAAALLAAGMLSLSHASDLLACGRFMQFFPPSIPQLMRLTGVVYPYEAKDHLGGLHTFPVSIDGHTFIFRTEEAQTLTGSSNGFSVLSRLFPSDLRFIGSKDLMATLSAPETQGKKLVLTGHLYFSSNRFWVRELEETQENPE